MIQTRPWPEIEDYQRTIRHPRHCFRASELRAGIVKTDRHDLPIPMTGKSAVVFQLQSGSRASAVRCFRRPVTSQKHRYEVLSRFLVSAKLPNFVYCTYLEQGIWVQGQSYPIVRMEWISGDPLHTYVEAHVRQGSVLGQLAIQWRDILAGLRRVHMAHGDLQHDNILVDRRGKLWLVDYDGVYIRDLRQHPPCEKGHSNYQHPRRTLNDYSETIDAFSALVIYLSLVAVRADPGLWTSSIHTGDNLIFVANDLEKPGQTPLWNRLRKSPDAEVQRLTAELEHFCRATVSSVPALQNVLDGAATANLLDAIGESQKPQVRPTKPVSVSKPVVPDPAGKAAAQAPVLPPVAIHSVPPKVATAPVAVTVAPTVASDPQKAPSRVQSWISGVWNGVADASRHGPPNVFRAPKKRH